MIEYETDSRKVTPGQTFVAISGYTVDGHDFIKQAIDNGAEKIIVEKDVDFNIPTIKVENTKEFLKKALIEKYSQEFTNMHIVGVTGTNGKTTTCYLTYQMLKNLGYKVAYIGTIGFFYGNKQMELPNTTPDILTLYKLILEAKNYGCNYIVMEVSSHSLEEERIKGLLFDACAFTNLTQDHLDFHKTMENYLKAKIKILTYLKDDGKIIVNNDDSYAQYFYKDEKNTIKIGFKDDNNITIKNIDYLLSNTKITFTYNNETYNVKTQLTSLFNVYNYLTMLSLLLSLNIDINQILEKTSILKAPKGRCEIINVNNSIAVIDYAHTPDAVEKVINSFKNINHNKLYTIVGCGGDRDATKRPIMGKISCDNSDYVIFTNDNPRTENPEKIMHDITNNISYSNYEVIYDRKKAIYKGLSILKENDILLILGKGHEDYQIIGHNKIHFDDSEIVNNYIAENK